MAYVNSIYLVWRINGKNSIYTVDLKNGYDGGSYLFCITIINQNTKATRIDLSKQASIKKNPGCSNIYN